MGSIRQGHILSACFGILLLCLVLAGILFSDSIPHLGWIGGYSIAFLLIYLAAIRIIFVYEKKMYSQEDGQGGNKTRYQKITLRQAFIRYALNALVVIVAVIFLPEFGKKIAEQTGLEQTFVGTVFVAASTSLPELTVSIAAVRIGAIDMAAGNLFGSNLFNIFILAIDDFFWTKGGLLLSASHGHIISAIVTIMMTAIAIMGLTFHTDKKKWLLALDSIAILVVYILAMIFLYRAR